MSGKTSNTQNQFALSAEWMLEYQRVGMLRDALGRPVDAQIQDLVVALGLFGFLTTMSCEGHADRVTGGPYVGFRSLEGHAMCVDAYRLPPSDRRTRQMTMARELTLIEANRLRKLIELFEASRSSSLKATRMQVVVRPEGAFRLQFVHADFDQLRSRKELPGLVQDRQAVLCDFVRFLGDAWLNRAVTI